MGCFSGCLMSAASDQKLFCKLCSPFCCSFNEFVEEKVISPSYSSVILTSPPIMDAFKFSPVSCNIWAILASDNCFSHLNMFYFLGSSCINFGLYLEHYQCCLDSEFCWFNPMNIVSMLLADNFQGWTWTANYISYVADSVSVQSFWMSLDYLGSISHMQRYNSFTVLRLD